MGWLPHVLVGLLALPFILGQNSWFEWGNALWLLELQTAHVHAHGIPTYFIHAAGAYFYPQQLFYAGPLISVLAYPSVIFGAWAVFAAVTAGAFIAASAGISWTARNLGVPSRLALLPGILFACTPYFVSNLYGRGDWAELVATGALAVAVGAATSLLTARARSVPGMVAVLALTVATIAGVHNLTLLFSALVSPLLAVAILPLVSAPAREVWRRYGLVIGGAALGLAIDGTFLVPDVWLAGRTYTSHVSAGLLTQVTGFDQLGTVFNPLPVQPAGTTGSDVHTQSLALALAWLVVAGGWLAARRRLPRRPAITVAILVLSGLGVALLISHPDWWLSFPPTLRAIQFTFRLVTFLSLLIVVALSVLLSVVVVRRSRLAVALLVLVAVWQVGVAGYLAISAKARPPGTPTTSSSVRAAATPAAYQSFQQASFRMFVEHPVLAPPAAAGVRPVGHDTPAHIELYGSQPAGSFVSTRVVGSPLIRVSGDVSISGVTADDLVVLYIRRSPWRATVSPACGSCLGALSGSAPGPLLAGRLLTLVGVLGVGALSVIALRDGRRHRTEVSTTPA
ncbi:MAG: hypothetical protein WAU75_11990 [Solirubrobacteraceae bacterium]